MANKPTKAEYEGFKKAVANPMTPAPIKQKLQSIIDQYASEYEGGSEAPKAEPKSRAGRKPSTPRATKKTASPRATKKTATDIEQAKAEIKAKTGKTEAECEAIIEQYRSLRSKAQEGKRKAEQATATNKKRVAKLEDKGDLIEGTNVKTADAVIESTAKDVAEKIEQQIEAVEEKAEKEAKAEVAKDNTKKTPTQKQEAVEAKVEKKVKEKTRVIVKKVVIDTSALLTSIATSLGKFDKDSQKEFLIKLRSDIDKLLAKYAFGGMTDGATQVMNVQQSNMSSSSVNPTMFANGGGVDNLMWEKGFIEPDEDSDDRRYAKYETEIGNLEITIADWGYGTWKIWIMPKTGHSILKLETFEGDLEGAKDYAISLAKKLESNDFANGGGVSKRGGLFSIGDKVMVNDEGYVKSFQGFDLSQPATIISKNKVKLDGKTHYTYGLEFTDGRKPFNNASEKKLSLVKFANGGGVGKFAEGGSVDEDIQFAVVIKKDDKNYNKIGYSKLTEFITDKQGNEFDKLYFEGKKLPTKYNAEDLNYGVRELDTFTSSTGDRKFILLKELTDDNRIYYYILHYDDKKVYAESYDMNFIKSELKRLTNGKNFYSKAGVNFAEGGMVGQEIVFDDMGAENTGVIKEITNLGDYVVKADDGRTLLAQRDLDVISFGAMRQQGVEQRKKRFGFFAEGGNVSDLDYDNILAVLEDKLTEAVANDIPNHFENSYNAEGEEVEHQSRDGFIAYTDGGFEVRWFEYLSGFWGSGYSLPTSALDEEKERQIDYSLEMAKEYFIDQYPEIVEELGEDNINYNSLYEAGYESEAEELSEAEMENMDGTIMCEVGAYYYTPNNDRGIEDEHTLRLFGLVNLESPYHRNGNLEDRYDIDITFNSIEELEEILEIRLKEITDWFNGSNYSESTDKLRIVRMAKGGLTEHGLKLGDKIVGVSGSERELLEIENRGKKRKVNLETGKRSNVQYAKGGKLWIDTKGKGGLKGVKPSRKNTFRNEAVKRNMTSGQLASKVLASPSRYKGINPRSAQLVKNMGVRKHGGSIGDILRNRRGE